MCLKVKWHKTCLLSNLKKGGKSGNRMIISIVWLLDGAKDGKDYVLSACKVVVIVFRAHFEHLAPCY